MVSMIYALATNFGWVGFLFVFTLFLLSVVVSVVKQLDRISDEKHSQMRITSLKLLI